MIEFIKNAGAFDKIIPDDVLAVSFCRVTGKKSIHLMPEKFDSMYDNPEIRPGKEQDIHFVVWRGIEIFCVKPKVSENEKE